MPGTRYERGKPEPMQKEVRAAKRVKSLELLKQDTLDVFSPERGDAIALQRTGLDSALELFDLPVCDFRRLTGPRVVAKPVESFAIETMDPLSELPFSEGE